jgi:phosphoribosylaminoimidazolecarboxamide formyltransferase/IMP cyclohydrolase
MKRALVSVSNKTGLVNFLKPLCETGLEIISTGGTLKFLLESGIPAIDVSSVTNFPEVLDGRVKTLHPHIHMGLLARKEIQDHVDQMKHHGVLFFDMVIGNLYPFEKTALNPDSTFEEQIENIDIGGPSFLRSAAKNFSNVIVVSDPTDYEWVSEKYINQTLTIQDRKKLAIKVFSLTSYYDSLIVQKISENIPDLNLEYMNLPLKKKQNLRYGENAQQKAIWYTNPLSKKNLSDAEIIQGKELSYNNILDIDAAAGLVCQLNQPACVAVKHSNPCGVAMADTIYSATEKAIESDPKSVFGGILAFNREIDLETAEYLHPLFLECLIAPSYSQKALDKLSSKKNLRVLSWPAIGFNFQMYQSKSVSGGLLVQDDDFWTTKNWTVIGESPNLQIEQDMLMGEVVCSFLKSNAIALIYKGQTVGLGMGQVNRVDAVQQAISRLKQFSQRHEIHLNDVVAVSDAFFPFSDSVKQFHDAGLRWIFQPGGSVKDSEVISFVENHNMNMVLSGQRHFRH